MFLIPLFDLLHLSLSLSPSSLPKPETLTTDPAPPPPLLLVPAPTLYTFQQVAFAFARFINPSAPKALGRHFIGFALAGAVASLALLALKRHAEPLLDPRTGSLLDAGGDLAEVGGTTSTFHDAIYVSSAALLLGAKYDAALLLLLLFPVYGGFLFWKSVLSPFIFTPTAAEARSAASAAASSEGRSRGAVPRGGKQKQKFVRRG